MAHIHLIEGPVGSGKSTFASKLSKELRAPHINLDDWMAILFIPDRPSVDIAAWYMERKDRCIDQIWKTAVELLSTGSDVILELGLIREADRQQFFERVDASAFGMKIYVLDAPRHIRKERVLARNRQQGKTFSMEVPDHIFELASDMWEPIEQMECRSYRLTFISTADQPPL